MNNDIQVYLNRPFKYNGNDIQREFVDTLKLDNTNCLHLKCIDYRLVNRHTDEVSNIRLYYDIFHRDQYVKNSNESIGEPFATPLILTNHPENYFDNSFIFNIQINHASSFPPIPIRLKTGEYFTFVITLEDR